MNTNKFLASNQSPVSPMPVQQNVQSNVPAANLTSKKDTFEKQSKPKNDGEKYVIAASIAVMVGVFIFLATRGKNKKPLEEAMQEISGKAAQETAQVVAKNEPVQEPVQEIVQEVAETTLNKKTVEIPLGENEPVQDILQKTVEKPLNVDDLQEISKRTTQEPIKDEPIKEATKDTIEPLTKHVEPIVKEVENAKILFSKEISDIFAESKKLANDIEDNSTDIVGSDAAKFKTHLKEDLQNVDIKDRGETDLAYGALEDLLRYKAYGKPNGLIPEELELKMDLLSSKYKAFLKKQGIEVLEPERGAKFDSDTMYVYEQSSTSGNDYNPMSGEFSFGDTIFTMNEKLVDTVAETIGLGRKTETQTSRAAVRVYKSPPREVGVYMNLVEDLNTKMTGEDPTTKFIKNHLLNHFKTSVEKKPTEVDLKITSEYLKDSTSGLDNDLPEVSSSLKSLQEMLKKSMPKDEADLDDISQVVKKSAEKDKPVEEAIEEAVDGKLIEHTESMPTNSIARISNFVLVEETNVIKKFIKENSFNEEAFPSDFKFVPYAIERNIEHGLTVLSLLDSMKTLCVCKSNRENSVLKESMSKVDSLYDLMSTMAQKNGVEIIRPEIGSKFNPNSMYASSAVQTEDLSKVGLVQSVVYEAYKYQGKIIERPEVRVYIPSRRKEYVAGANSIMDFINKSFDKDTPFAKEFKEKFSKKFDRVTYPDHYSPSWEFSWFATQEVFERINKIDSYVLQSGKALDKSSFLAKEGKILADVYEKCKTILEENGIKVIDSSVVKVGDAFDESIMYAGPDVPPGCTVAKVSKIGFRRPYDISNSRVSVELKLPNGKSFVPKTSSWGRAEPPKIPHMDKIQKFSRINEGQKLTEEYAEALKNLGNVSAEHLKALEFRLNRNGPDFRQIMDDISELENRLTWRKFEPEVKESGNKILGELKSILKKYDISLLETKIGDDFDSETMRVVGRVDTSDVKNCGKIDYMNSHGFKLGDELIRPASVSIRKHNSISQFFYKEYDEVELYIKSLPEAYLPKKVNDEWSAYFIRHWKDDENRLRNAMAKFFNPAESMSENEKEFFATMCEKCKTILQKNNTEVLDSDVIKIGAEFDENLMRTNRTKTDGFVVEKVLNPGFRDAYGIEPAFVTMKLKDS